MMRALIALCGVGLLACGNPPAPPDAGPVDAGSSDAGVDAGPPASLFGIFHLEGTLALGLAGLGWVNGWAAMIGALAGVFFLFQGELMLTFMYPFFLVIFTVVSGGLVEDPGLNFLIRGLGHLFITGFFASFVTDFSFEGSSFDSTGVSSRRSRSDDWDTGGWSGRSSRSSSSSSSMFGSSSSSSHSSSSKSSYSGGGGSFGGGGASSGW